METDALVSSSASPTPSRLSMSSPGRLLLRPPEFSENAETNPPSPPSYRHHMRRESYTPSTTQSIHMVPSMEALTAGLTDESERSLFAPPTSSQSSVRRIIRNDSFSDG